MAIKEIEKYTAMIKINTVSKSPKLAGYHKAGYIVPCSSFSFKLANGKTFS